MKKLILTLLSIFALVACGGEESTGEAGDIISENEVLETIIVGASPTPHAEILEAAKPLLAEKGYELDIRVFQDYILPNRTLTDGELNANYFQHTPYLENYNEENGTNIVKAAGIHVEPIGIYSKNYSSLEDLPEGAEVIMSSSPTDQGRMLTLLEAKGLITLDPTIDLGDLRLEHIVDNPKNLEFRADIDPGMLVQAYRNNEGDAVLINTNFALDGGLEPLKDAIALEDADSPFVNIIAVNPGDENSEKIQALIDVLHSEEIHNFIIKTFPGAVNPVSE